MKSFKEWLSMPSNSSEYKESVIGIANTLRRVLKTNIRKCTLETISENAQNLKTYSPNEYKIREAVKIIMEELSQEYI